MSTTVRCSWCGCDAVLDGQVCPGCGLHPAVPAAANGSLASTGSRRNRVKSAAAVDLDVTPQGRPVLGIDPGARYVGLVVRDGNAVLWAETFTDQVQDTALWCRRVLSVVGEVITFTSPTLLAVETITSPKGFKDGRKAPINPGFVARTAAVFGAVLGAWPEVVPVPPGGNGSRHTSRYPQELVGRRPEGLPGRDWRAGTRAHEQSAYDVAGRAGREVFGDVTAAQISTDLSVLSQGA